MLFSSRIIWWLQKNNVSLQQKCYNRQFENKFSLCLFALSINQITKILLMGKIVDKTETKIVTLDGVEIIKQVTKVLMPNGKYRYPTVYFTVNDDVKALTAEQLDKIRIPVYKQLI
jgi:CRISPR/Cas system endoribonuclease Cas6 (RAMP superfamily)